MKKLSIFTVGLLISFMSILVNCAGATPVQYSENGHYYDVISAPGITWGDANTSAQALSYSGVNGHLATITSQGENDFIVTKFNPDWHWLGGSQPANSPEPDGGWQWVTGEPWNYTNWNNETSEPTNDGGTEDVLQFWSLSGMWNDISNDSLSDGYIVEYEVTSHQTLEFPSVVLAVAAIGLLSVFGRRKT
jgi:hypothetical protein